MERKACSRGSSRWYSHTDCPQTYGRAGAFRGRLRLPDSLSAHASGICRADGQERQGARQGKLSDHRQSEALAAAVPGFTGHGEAEHRSLKQLVRSNWQFAHTFTCGMVDCVRDCGGHACYRNLSCAPRPDIRINVWIRFVDEIDFNRMNVGVD